MLTCCCARANYASYPQPTPVWYALGPTIKTWVANGVKGIFMEGVYGTSGGDMDALKTFLVGRLMWEPTLDPDALIEQFLTGYFGPAAAPFVRQYLDIFNASATECGCRVGVHEYWSARTHLLSSSHPLWMAYGETWLGAGLRRI